MRKQRGNHRQLLEETAGRIDARRNDYRIAGQQRELFEIGSPELAVALAAYDCPVGADDKHAPRVGLASGPSGIVLISAYPIPRRVAK